MLKVTQHNGIQEMTGVVENDTDLARVAQALDTEVKADPFLKTKYVANTTVDKDSDHIRSSWIIVGCWVWFQFTVVGDRPAEQSVT